MKSQSKIRIFSALTINEKSKKEIEKRIKELDLDINQKNLHLTMNFFGNVDKKDIDKIWKEQVSNFRLDVNKEYEFNSIIGLPSSKKPRVLCLKTQDKELNEINRRLGGRGLAHITFFRNKRKIEKFEEIKIKPIKIRFNGFCLFQSVLEKTGAKHIRLRCV